MISDSTSDFEKLAEQIIAKTRALMTPTLLLEQAAKVDQASPQEGLSHQELIVLGVLAGETAVVESTVAFYSLKHTAERAGLTSIGFGLAIRRLLKHGLVVTKTEKDYEGDDYMAVQLTDLGWKWIDDNQRDFILHRVDSTRKGSLPSEPLDDDIPF